MGGVSGSLAGLASCNAYGSSNHLEKIGQVFCVGHGGIDTQNPCQKASIMDGTNTEEEDSTRAIRAQTQP